MLRIGIKMLSCTDYTDKKYFLKYYLHKHIAKIFYPYILKSHYKRFYNTTLDLKSPAKLSEKIQWIKLYDNNPLKTLLTDKILCKKYIEKQLPELKTAKVYCEFDKAEDINFSDLPDEFVLKTNHSWKTNIYIQNKNDVTKKKLDEYKKYYKNALNINYAYWSYFELHYENIKPKVFAEEFYGDIWSVKQYEVWCFNGSPEFIVCGLFVMEHNISSYKQYIYDSNWEKLNFNLFNSLENDEINKPKNIDKILKYSKQLAKNFKLVRIDFIENKDNELMLNEMTFTPCSGYIKFIGENCDLYYGKKLKLN